jgi:hypothetical protein
MNINFRIFPQSKSPSSRICTEIKNFYLIIPTLQSASGLLVAQAAIAASTATTPTSANCLAFP